MNLNWILRAILRAFIWRGVGKLTRTRRPRKHNYDDTV